MPEEVPALRWMPQAAARSGVSRALLCPALQEGPQQLQTHPTMGPSLIPVPGDGTEGPSTSPGTRCPLRFTAESLVLRDALGVFGEMWVSELS